MNNKLKLMSIVLALFTFSSFTFADNVPVYRCETGLDQMNEKPIATFDIGEKEFYKQVLLDEGNRIWSICYMFNPTSFRRMLGCLIGQMPPNLPPEQQNSANLVQAANGVVGAQTIEFYINTKSYISLKSEKHVNYIPYVSCGLLYQ